MMGETSDKGTHSPLNRTAKRTRNKGLDRGEGEARVRAGRGRGCLREIETDGLDGGGWHISLL